jgi:predicted MPP superfamily phosphohydrolase
MHAKKSIKIGWLSDIHYKTDFDKNPHMNAYFDAISRLFKENKIDYLVITGDLAFSGDISEYSALETVLKTHFSPYKVVCVPGNHEVDWMTYKGILGNVDLDGLRITNEKIASKPTNYRRIFSAYFAFYSRLNPGATSKHDDFGHGFWHDESSNVLFLMLNSAWLSFGDEIIFNAFDKTLKSFGNGTDSFEKFRAKYGGDALSQASFQSYFLNHFANWNEINKIITDSSPTVISLVHHPPSWLNWSEQHGANSALVKLEDLIQKSHIMLSGHLHVPYIQTSILEDACIHLNTGCLLDYHKVDAKKDIIANFSGSIVGVLDIEDSVINIETYQFAYKSNSIVWELISERRKKINLRKPNPMPLHSDPEIREFCDLTVGSLSELIASHRNYKLGYVIIEEKNKLVKDKWYKYTFDDEVHLISVNSLPNFKDIKDFDNAHKGSQWPFGDLSFQLNDKTLKGKNVIVSFVDVIQAQENLTEEAEQKWAQVYHTHYFNQQLRFQRFKISFFNKKPLVKKFMNHSITYDCLLV